MGLADGGARWAGEDSWHAPREAARALGTVHANAWHHAHNEGVTEWPPSPWRILRALVAAAYDLGLEAEATPLIEKLAALPRYRVPAAREAHTRHYMPDVADAAHKKTKVFDTFVAVDGGATDPQALIVAWPTTVSGSERALLERLAGRISYLGRAESWAELAVIEVSEPGFNCHPDESGTADASTTLMAPEPEAAFRAWADAQPRPKKKGARDVPRSLWDVLTFSADRFRDEGWSRVPGTVLSRYVFSEPPFRGRSVAAAVGQRRALQRPTVAVFAIRAPVLPKITAALSVGERVRTSLMSRSERISGSAKPVFSGHTDVPLDHGHAFYLSGANTSGFVDHVAVTARMGFDDDDVRALQSLRRVWGRGGHDLELVLVGMWTNDDARDVGGQASPLLGTSRVWESLTPFVPTRHPKMKRGAIVDSVPDQIRLAARQTLGVEPNEVIEAAWHHSPWHAFQRRRRAGGGSRGPDRAYGVRLVFADPIPGPIALGFGAHFGLGAFVPVDG